MSRSHIRRVKKKIAKQQKEGAAKADNDSGDEIFDGSFNAGSDGVVANVTKADDANSKESSDTSSDNDAHADDAKASSEHLDNTQDGSDGSDSELSVVRKVVDFSQKDLSQYPKENGFVILSVVLSTKGFASLGIVSEESIPGHAKTIGKLEMLDPISEQIRALGGSFGVSKSHDDSAETTFWFKIPLLLPQDSKQLQGRKRRRPKENADSESMEQPTSARVPRKRAS
jgi:hypothetical protein